jgi:hypothetical protein
MTDPRTERDAGTIRSPDSPQKQASPRRHQSPTEGTNRDFDESGESHRSFDPRTGSSHQGLRGAGGVARRAVARSRGVARRAVARRRGRARRAVARRRGVASR